MEIEKGTPTTWGLERKWWVLLAVGVGTFMSALDASVVNIVLPVVNQAFGSQVANVEWVITIYLLVVSGLLLSFGRLGDMRGHKVVYVAGFVIFVLGSALSGLAQAVWVLVAFRAFQAVGAAMLFANSPAILTKNFPESQRGQALGLQAAMTYLGLTLGPALGGWLTDSFSWRAVFYINVPIGILALLLSWTFIPNDTTHKEENFDWTGAITFIVGLILLLLALNQGHSWGWLSPQTLGLAVISIMILGIFVSLERRSENPMLDLSLFSSRMFSASTLSAVFHYICIYSILFLMPFYLLQGRALSAAHAGLLLTAQPLVMVVMAPISGALSDWIGSRLPSTLGLGILGIAIVLLSRVGPATPLPYVVLSLGLAGLGAGAFTSPNNSALMGAAPKQRQGIAAGILATARNVGMVLGIGFAGAVFTTVLAHGRSGSGQALFQAVQTALLMASGVAFLGALTSALRGKDFRNEKLP